MMETEFFWYHCCAVLAALPAPVLHAPRQDSKSLARALLAPMTPAPGSCFHSLCKHPDKQVLEHLIISSSTIREHHHHHHHHHHHQTNCEDITSEGAADISQVVVVGVK